MKSETINRPSSAQAIIDVIYRRRAVRSYTDQPVARNIVEEILDAGRMAPSAINKQPWKFYILTNKDTIKTFSREIAKVTARTFAKQHTGDVLKVAFQFLHMLKEGELFKRPDPIFHGAPVVVFIAAARENE